MNEAPLPPARALAAILRLKARKTWNRLTAGWSARWRSGRPPQARAGTPRKSRGGPVLAFLMFAVFLYNGVLLSFQALHHLQDHLAVPERLAPGPSPARTPEAARGAEEAAARAREAFEAPDDSRLRSRPFLGGVAFVASFLALTLVFVALGFGNVDLTRLDLEVEWMLTLPVSVPAVYAGRVAERTLLNLLGWFLLAPFYGTVLWQWGYGWGALPIAAALTLGTHALVAVLQFGLELVCRRLLTPYTLRNLQAFATLIATVMMLLALSVGTQMGRSDYFLYDWMRAAGPVAEQLPPGIALRLLQGTHAASPALLAALLAAEVAVLLFGGWCLVEWASRRGLEAVQSGLRGVRDAAGTRPSGEFFGGILGKDLRLLWRDKRLLVSVAILPFVLFAFQVLLNPDFLNVALGQPRVWGVVAFGLGVYTLLSSVPGVIFHEQQALWILYTVPCGLGRILLRKAWIWIGVAWLYAFAALAFGIWHRGGPTAEDLPGLFWTLAGLPLYGLIGTALGVLGADPLAAEPQYRMRTDLVYLLLFLGGLLTGSLYLPTGWAQVVSLLMFGSLALALWQKVDRRVDYLLDPTAVPPRRIDLADGLVAVVLFFFLQAFTVAYTHWVLGMTMDAALAISYVAAGAVSVPAALYILWREGIRVRESIRLWSRGGPGAVVLTGLLGGATAAAAGALYLQVLRRIPGVVPDESSLPMGRETVAFLAVVAAPVFEEILFRGFVFRGMRQGMGFLPAAAASALIFAIVHPPEAVIPVFVLGAAAAWACEITGGLLAPVLAHAVYNAAVLVLQ